jgi:O-antigen/teichoic acid export membrane protein
MADIITYLRTNKMIQRLSSWSGWADMFSFHRMVAGTLLTHGFLLIFSTLASILVTRALGTQGRGTIAWIMAYIGFGVTFAILGIGAASKKYVAKAHDQAPVFIVLNFIILSFSSLFFMPVFYFYGASSPVAQQNPLLFLLGIVMIPLMALSGLLTEIMVGLDKGLHYNVVCTAEKIFYVILSLILVASGHISPITLFLAFAAGVVCRLTISIIYIKPHMRYFPSIAQMRAAFRSMRTLVFTSYFSNLAMNYTSGLLTIVLGLVVTTRELGYYSTARFVVDTSHMFPATVALYTLPRLLQEKTQQGFVRTIRHILSLTFLGTAVIAVILYFFSDLIVAIVFGPDFMPAAECMKIMGIGMVAFGITSVCQAIITGHHQEMWVPVSAGALALATTVLTLLYRDQLSAVSASWIYSGTQIIGMLVALGIIAHVRWVE